MDATKLMGYLLISTLMIFYCISIICAQLIGQYIPILQLNTIRFTAQAALCAIVAKLLKINLFSIANVRDILLMSGNALVYAWMYFSVFAATLFAPVGNLSAVQTAVCIGMAMGLAVMKRTVSAALVCAAIFGVAGK